MTAAVTLDELRELSRRSRRAGKWGALSLVGTLALLPALALVANLAPAWYAAATYAAVAVGGALFLAYAFVAGEERGAFRKVFKRVKDERSATRSVPVEETPVRVATIQK